MEFKKLLGDKYKEDLTPEQLLELLKEVDLPEQKPMEDFVKKDVFDKAASELADYKKQVKALENEKKQLENSGLSESEKLNQKIQNLENNVIRLEAEKTLAPLGVATGDLVEKILSGDRTSVFEDLAKLIGEVKDEAVKSTKLEVLNSSPKPEGSPKASGSKPDLSTMTTTELMKFKAENPELYEQMQEGV